MFQMPKILDEIRSQPEHIRHIFMWLCVVISFSLVVVVWFKSTQSKFVALLHSSEVREEIDPRRFVDGDLKNLKNSVLSAKEKEERQSLFASIGSAFALIKESIADLIGSSQKELEVSKEKPVKVLPLSEDR